MREGPLQREQKNQWPSFISGSKTLQPSTVGVFKSHVLLLPDGKTRTYLHL